MWGRTARRKDAQTKLSLRPRTLSVAPGVPSGGRSVLEVSNRAWFNPHAASISASFYRCESRETLRA